MELESGKVTFQLPENVEDEKESCYMGMSINATCYYKILSLLFGLQSISPMANCVHRLKVSRSSHFTRRLKITAARSVLLLLKQIT